MKRIALLGAISLLAAFTPATLAAGTTGWWTTALASGGITGTSTLTLAINDRSATAIVWLNRLRTGSGVTADLRAGACDTTGTRVTSMPAFTTTSGGTWRQRWIFSGRDLRALRSALAKGQPITLRATVGSRSACAQYSEPAGDTIDFSTFGDGREFDPLFYQDDRIVFPPQQCGPVGCGNWFVGFIQGDAALVGGPLLAPIEAMFTKPIFGLSLRVAPGAQGTAEYTLTAFNSGGHVVARKSVTITQDMGDPLTDPFGYFSIDLGRFRQPATSFTLGSKDIRSSFGLTGRTIEYGVSSITFVPAGPGS